MLENTITGSAVVMQAIAKAILEDKQVEALSHKFSDLIQAHVDDMGDEGTSILQMGAALSAVTSAMFYSFYRNQVTDAKAIHAMWGSMVGMVSAYLKDKVPLAEEDPRVADFMELLTQRQEETAWANAALNGEPCPDCGNVHNIDDENRDHLVKRFRQVGLDRLANMIESGKAKPEYDA